ncbi:sushi domain-containing 2-like [Brachionus plicatilis]|uniref:Sushi domain-containing 2-like n=1 Tax=Brachionus plicatilis TaxID=10195 RepID=A0A3M7QCI8_BRAPC|nr:sushi domain-containing 2-like [Brachionus plicatilis]
MNIIFFLFLLLINCLDSTLDILYPFGSELGDDVMFKNDDEFLGPFDIAIEFPFFNKSFSSLFINTNGLISFKNGISSFTPIPFPIYNVTGVAPFWNDIDTRKGGDIFFRSVTDFNTLNQIGSDIRSSFSDFANFRPSWALIVTWFQVAQYSQSINFPKNTFQALISTNGRHSFTIFNYHKLEWSRSGNYNKHAQAGFNAGDGIIHYALNRSFTPSVTNIVSESNVNKPGRWIFRIDDQSIEEGGCNTQGYVTLSPFVLYFIGGEEVLVTGPCFDIVQDEAKIIIDSYDEIECQIIDSNSCKFRTPLFKKNGRMPLILRVNDNQTFHANIYTKDESIQSKINGLRPYFFKTNESNEQLNLEWHNDIKNQLYDIYVIRISENDSVSVKLIESNLGESFISINSSLLFFDDSSNIIENCYLAIGIKKTLNTQIQLKNYLFIYNFFVLNSNLVESRNQKINFFFDSYCENWASDQPDPTPYLEGLPPCWPILPSAVNVPESFGDFVQDKACNPSRPQGCSSFHPGSNVCYRSQSSFTLNSFTAGQQCCYDSQNNLLVGPPGGGTLDMAHTDEKPISHFFDDVVAYFFCCKFSDNCNKYYEKRPSDDGSRWTPPSPGGGSGDPHYTTFDGVEYTFNGLGEYLFFEINEINFTCQVRTSTLKLNGFAASEGTVFRAIAIRGDSNTDSIQIELDLANNVLIYINGIVVDFTSEYINLKQLTLKLNNATDIELTYWQGINFQILLTPQKNALLIFSSVDFKFKNKIKGLLGNFNGIQTDDFRLPDGTVLNLDKNNDRDIFQNFGQKWLVNSESSIFIYQQGFQHSNYVDLSYIPKFVQDGIIFSNSSLESLAREKCGENIKCLYDVSVTLDIEIGILSLKFDKKIEVFQQDLANISQALENFEKPNNETETSFLDTELPLSSSTKTLSSSSIETSESPSIEASQSSSTKTLSFSDTELPLSSSFKTLSFLSTKPSQYFSSERVSSSPTDKSSHTFTTTKINIQSRSSRIGFGQFGKTLVSFISLLFVLNFS